MRSAILAALFGLLLGAQHASAQVVVPHTVYMPVAPRVSATVTTFYAPSPVTSYYAPSPVTTYYAPAPVTTYYAPSPVTAYYAPAAQPVTTFYAPSPVTTYYAPAPVVAAPSRAVITRGLFGRPRGVLYLP